MYLKTRLMHWLDRRLSARYRDRPVLSPEEAAAHPDITVMRFGTPETITYATSKLPLPSFFPPAGTAQTWPPPYVLDIEGAQLRGRQALALTADGRIVLESVQDNTHTLTHISAGEIHFPVGLRDFWQQLRHHPRYGTVFALTNPFGNAYYHWLTENLPRLCLYEQYAAASGTRPPILIDPQRFDYVDETLNLLGIDNVITWDATHASFERLLIPSALHKSGIPSGRAARHLSERLKAVLARRAHSAHRRLYLSRQDARRRRIINEDAVLAILRRYGFKSVTLAGLSIAEQISLFEGAEVIIGAHGAAFANMIFGNDLTVIEFLPQGYPNHCFYALASGLGFEYAALLTEATANHDLRVDPAQLEEALVKLGL